MALPQDPMTPEMETEEPMDDGSYTICIRVDADGSISVGLEQEATGPADEYAGMKLKHS